MNRISIAALALVFTALVSGCNNAKSPDTVASDVADAQNKAATNVADAQKEAATDTAPAQAKLEDANAKGSYEVAVAKADGDQKIALAKCNAMSGDSQKACKDQADASHDMSIADAKATMAAQKP